MVMTLRKRVPPIKRSPSPVREITRKKETRKIPNSGKVKPRKKNVILESESESESESEGASSGYEKFREQRIKENRERMEKLGIFALATPFLMSHKGGPPKRRPTKNPPKKTRNPSLLPHPRSYKPGRRSSRLKNLPRANYLETKRSLEEMGISIPDAWKPEVYTEDDEKLLGDCETKWTLNVDGFGEDGERLYDPVNGTYCHQCRQKTLRKHTYCGKCRSGQGQLCGDCLYTRYGENVLEAIMNPTWMCPACRGICNCSRCRRAKGWPPLTILYPKVIELGFKSVAHYLILTRRAENMPKETKDEIVIVDSMDGEPPEPFHYKCSDTSDWSESESDSDNSDDDDDDDDDSKAAKKKMEYPVEKHADTAAETSHVNGGLNC